MMSQRLITTNPDFLTSTTTIAHALVLFNWPEQQHAHCRFCHFWCVLLDQAHEDVFTHHGYGNRIATFLFYVSAGELPERALVRSVIRTVEHRDHCVLPLERLPHVKHSVHGLL